MLDEHLRSAIDVWPSVRKTNRPRTEAIRRLVELGHRRFEAGEGALVTSGKESLWPKKPHRLICRPPDLWNAS